MVLKGTFKYAQEIVDVIIAGNNIMYTNGEQITTIEGLRLEKNGVIKEHPDLKDDEDWRKKSIERLKEHLKSLETEMDKLNYIRKELVKFGYESLYFQIAGWRPKRWKD